MSNETIKDLMITSKDFLDGGEMLTKNTGFGDDESPEFELHNLSEKAVSIAIVMNDLDIPMVPEYNHWIIWNISPMETIPGHIPAGEDVPSLGGAKQGIGYGKNKYRGPKQPFFVRSTHKYVFHFYVLDCLLELDAHSRRDAVVNSMNGHIIQQGSITGMYKRSNKNREN